MTWMKWKTKTPSKFDRYGLTWISGRVRVAVIKRMLFL